MLLRQSLWEWTWRLKPDWAILKQMEGGNLHKTSSSVVWTLPVVIKVRRETGAGFCVILCKVDKMSWKDWCNFTDLWKEKHFSLCFGYWNRQDLPVGSILYQAKYLTNQHKIRIWPSKYSGNVSYENSHVIPQVWSLYLLLFRGSRAHPFSTNYRLCNYYSCELNAPEIGAIKQK